MKRTPPSSSPRPLAGEGQGRGAVKARSPRLSFAKTLRQHQTNAEQCLWYYLRAHRFLGLKFMRQRPLGPYIVDFVCYERKLIIEVDGGQHNEETLETDRVRDAWLEAKGFKVLRFWNNDVPSSTASVLESIRLSVEFDGPSPPAPLSSLRSPAPIESWAVHPAPPVRPASELRSQRPAGRTPHVGEGSKSP